jgi:hypothetical protein
MSRASFEREWGAEYERPGWWSRFLAFVFRLMPKVGPLQAFAFKAPGPEAQKLFTQGFNETVEQYHKYLADVRADRLRLSNQNLDTGKAIEFGAYKLTDKAFERLLNELSDRDTVAPEVRSAVLAYYSGAKKLDRKTAAKLSKFRESSRSSSPGLP